MKTMKPSQWINFIGAALILFSGVGAYADSTPTANETAAAAICANIVDASTQQVIGLNGSDGWTAQDTTDCSNAAIPSPTPSSTPNLTVNQFRCLYHTGQLMQQCLAMDAAKSAGEMEKMIDVLDAAAAAVCFTACADVDLTSKVNLATLCNYGSIGAGAAEILDTFMEKSSAVGEAVNSMMGLAGVGAGIVGMKGGLGVVGNSSIKGSAANGTKDSKANKIESCGTAALMTVEGALRLKNIMAQDSAKSNAANAIVALGSDAPGTGTGTTTGSLTAAANTAANTGVGSGNSTADGLSGSTTASPYACAAVGMGTGAGQCGVGTAALSDPDVAALNSPLGAAAADYAAQNPDIGNALSGNGSGSSGSGSGGPDLSPISDLAKATLESASALASGAQGGTVMAKSAGLAAPAKSTLDFSPIGASAATPATDVSFGSTSANAAAANDIWHTGSKQSIFAITSAKIAASSSRVESVGYVSKMNQILSGQTQRMPAAVTSQPAVQTQTGSK